MLHKNRLSLIHPYPYIRKFHDHKYRTLTHAIHERGSDFFANFVVYNDSPQMRDFRNIGIIGSIVAAFALLTLYSCASIGSPSGGSRDEDAPRFVRSNPAPFATGFNGDRVEIEFDELVAVKDAFTSVTLSPPQRSTPKVRASGHSIIVEFNDSLTSGTTYSIDFGKSIEDINEGNKLPGFSFSFATGEVLDTMQMSGIVLDALTLEPQQGILVGAYSNIADSAFLTLPLERATRTDDRGRFILRGLKPLPYRLFALADLNNDYHWDNPAELMGFYPTTITPYAEQAIANDTIFNLKTGETDSIVTRQRTRYLPNNLLLSVFDFGFRPQYVVNYERQDSTRLNVTFNQRIDNAPELTLIYPDAETLPNRWYMRERNERNDTLSYWLTPQLFGIDTIKAAINYTRIERGKEPESITDTLTFVTKHPKKGKPRKLTAKQMREDSIKAADLRFIHPTMAKGANQDVYRELIVEFPEPLTRLDTTAISLQQMTDSIWHPVQIVVRADSLVPRRLHINTGWEYSSDYSLAIDSLAAEGLSGRPSKPLLQKFKTKKREDYASLTLRIKPGDINGFVEILTSSDEPVQRAAVQSGMVVFPYLAPADYYARFIADANGNGRFDPGDYEHNIQPEDVYYYPKLLSLRRYDRNEEWDLNATPVDMQKPERLKKNKPDNPKNAARKKGMEENNEEDEESDYFDVNRNPFDPNDKTRRRQTVGSY